MYWATGQSILQAAKYVSRHPRLFPFILRISAADRILFNRLFSQNYGQQAVLTLELDSHTADAGLDTRIEAFLDVVASYLKNNRRKEREETGFKAAKVLSDDEKTWVLDSKGKDTLTDRVHVLLPSMGDFASQLLAAVLRRVGQCKLCIRSVNQELYTDKGTLLLQECLPDVDRGQPGKLFRAKRRRTKSWSILCPKPRAPVVLASIMPL